MRPFVELALEGGVGGFRPSASGDSTRMKLALIGVGQAGGKIVDELLRYNERTPGSFVTAALAINTATTDLRGLETVPESNRVLVGESRVSGHGVGADNELGAEIAEAERAAILGATDAVPSGRTDAFLVVGALGGGTGSGAGPVTAKHLRDVFTEPVYGLGVLPSSDEGGIYTLNAARSFRTFVREVDNLLVFDNDAWRGAGRSVRESYDEINREIATRFGMLFSAGELSAIDAVGESVVDASEIINTLATGGVATLGYASDTIGTHERSDGLLARFLDGDEREAEDAAAAVNRVQSAVRQATLGRLTLPCDVSSAERALVAIGGPPSVLDRKGIERGREWLEDEAATLEVRGGDFPRPGADEVSAAVLLSGVSDVPRVTEIQQVAIEAQDNMNAIEDAHDDQLDALVHDDDGELDPLF
jgi:cell division GTPase FtsZ